MNLIYFSAFVSFVLGASSYIIARFWVLPIYRYRKGKRAVAASLTHYRHAQPHAPSTKDDAANIAQLSRTLRQQAQQLSDSFDLELPHWYRMLLDNRGESPVEAARLLMKLANTRNAGHAESQIQRIMTALKL